MRSPICVATSLGQFCFDFVTEDVELASLEFCRRHSCGPAEAGALAVEGLASLRARGDRAEERLRSSFACGLKQNLSTASCEESDWTSAADALSVSKLTRRSFEVRAVAEGWLPEPEERCAAPDPGQAKIRACPLWSAYPDDFQNQTWPLRPADATQWFLLGERWAAREDYDFAIAAFLRASDGDVEMNALDLHLATIWSAWGGDLDTAVDLYGRVVARATIEIIANKPPDKKTIAVAASARLNAATTVPPIVPPVLELERWRTQLRRDLYSLATSPTAWRDRNVDPTVLAKHVGKTLFHVAHQSINEVRDQQYLAAALLRVAPDLATSVKVKKSSQRLRVGFVSAYMSDHSIGKMLGELVAVMSKAIDVHVFHITKGNEERDHVRSFVDANAKATTLDLDLDAAREAITAAQLDVLVYPDVGMEPWSYFLAFSRLARVQCVWWGHPVTTGLASIDFFLSLDTELHDADSSYAEQLIRLDHVNVAPFAAIDLRGDMIRQDILKPLDVLIGEGATGAVYLVLGRLFKLHPDFDTILLEILRRDETGIVGLIAEPQKPHIAAVWRRLRAAAKDDDALLQRIRFIDYWNYVQALASATVVLDTYPYGGCLTALDAMSNGVPFVTLPGPFERGRFAMSIYEQMNYTDLVARDTENFIDVAVTLGTDPMRRNNAARDLQEAYPRAHNVQAVAREWMDLFRRLDRTAI